MRCGRMRHWWRVRAPLPCALRVTRAAHGTGVACMAAAWAGVLQLSTSGELAIEHNCTTRIVPKYIYVRYLLVPKYTPCARGHFLASAFSFAAYLVACLPTLILCMVCIYVRGTARRRVLFRVRSPRQGRARAHALRSQRPAPSAARCSTPRASDST
eukprot:6196589-Pleurochrysis_carterae.AAC.1